MSKNWLLLRLGVHLVCWGCTYKFPCELRLIFFSTWGCRCTHCNPWLRLCCQIIVCEHDNLQLLVKISPTNLQLWCSWPHTGWPKIGITFMLSPQGSVATHLRCGGIFSDSIITNFLLQWNNLENRLIFGKVMAYKMVPIFWATLKTNWLDFEVRMLTVKVT